ncbi:MAG: hypothetical protein JWO67_28 [Streptosporangiaceae bacterium]|nr:hypothetical protein [Streptosporangiaceae bacterium]
MSRPKPPEARRGRPTSHLGRCLYCGKFGYPGRNAAKTAARALYPGDHLSAYECKLLPDDARPVWHIGHLPAAVAAGKLTRDHLVPPVRRLLPGQS